MKKEIKKLDKNFLWVLLIINHFSKHGGADLSEIVKADKRKVNLDMAETAKISNLLKKQKLIDFKIEGAQEIYTINSDGKKILNKNLKQLKQSEFMDFLSLAPDETIFRYRLYQIERFIFYGVIGFLLFQLSLFFIRTNHIYFALAIFFIDMLFIGLGIGFLSNILTVVLYEYFKSLEHWLKGKKSWKFFFKLFSKLDKNVLEKLSRAIFLVFLIIVLIFANLLFRKYSPEGWINFLWVEIILGIFWLIKHTIKKK